MNPLLYHHLELLLLMYDVMATLHGASFIVSLSLPLDSIPIALPLSFIMNLHFDNPSSLMSLLRSFT